MYAAIAEDVYDEFTVFEYFGKTIEKNEEKPPVEFCYVSCPLQLLNVCCPL